jgi:hypothetical protein
MSLEDFIFHHPAQVSLLGIQFQWTADTQVGRFALLSLSSPSEQTPFYSCALCLLCCRCCCTRQIHHTLHPGQAALAGAKTDKSVMVKNMKKTDALLRWVTVPPSADCRSRAWPPAGSALLQHRTAETLLPRDLCQCTQRLQSTPS